MNKPTLFTFGLAMFCSAAADETRPYPAIPSARLDSLQIVGEFEFAVSWQALFGDTDHDGQNELILRGSTASREGVLRILELQGDPAAFEVAFEGPDLTPLAVGDLDQDGKSDLVVQESGWVFVYESLDSHSHPTQLVWQSPQISNVLGFSEIADTDSDGQLEIVYLVDVGEFRVIIFECDGDNQYTLKYVSPAGPASAASSSLPRPEPSYTARPGAELVFDLNVDGRPEIVRGSSGAGTMVIFESPANDVWEPVFSDSTGLVPLYIMGGGADTDEDGKPELFVGGIDWTHEEYRTYVYQRAGDALVRVDTLSAYANAGGPISGAIVQLEPGGRRRFLWSIYEKLSLYAATSAGEWTLEYVIPSSYIHLPRVYGRDLNRNGRDEIYLVSANSNIPSRILERPTLPTDVQEGGGHWQSAALRILPSPCRSDARFVLEPTIAPRATNWEAFDAAGRLVLRGDITSTRLGWHFPADRVQPGHYFIRITDAAGRTLATGRTTVVR